MSDFDVEKALHSQIRRAVIAWEEGGGDIEVMLKARLAGYRPPALPASKETSDRLVELRSMAERQTEVYAKMLELEGVVLLAEFDRKMFDDMLDWNEETGNDFADVILFLLDVISDKFDVMKSVLLDLPATRTHGVFTPSTEWVRIMVGYAMTTAVDRKMSVEDARQEGYAWFDRWIAAVSGERGRDFMAEVEADVSVANEIV